MNAHHAWRNTPTKRPQRHEDLVPLMANTGNSLLNVADVPTYYYHTGKGNSVIDITFISPSLNDERRNWAVKEEAHTASDHATIRFELVSQSALIHNPPTAPEYNCDKEDWELFKNTLRNPTSLTATTWQLLHDNRNKTNLDSSAQLLRDLILNAIEKAVPPVSLSPFSNRWWDLSLTEARKHINTRHKDW
jgi:hypothetical protein